MGRKAKPIAVEIQLPGTEQVIKPAPRVALSKLLYEIHARIQNETTLLVYEGGFLCGVYFPITGHRYNGAETGKLAGMRLEIEAWYVSQELRAAWSGVAIAPDGADYADRYWPVWDAYKANETIASNPPVKPAKKPGPRRSRSPKSNKKLENKPHRGNP